MEEEIDFKELERQRKIVMKQTIKVKKSSEAAKEMEYTIKEVMNIKFDEVGKHLDEIKLDVKEAVALGKLTNGRVTKLENWSNEAKKIIESTTTIASDTLLSYKIDKARLWTAIGVITLVAGALITLSIMAIDNKIKETVNSVFSEYEIDTK